MDLDEGERLEKAVRVPDPGNVRELPDLLLDRHGEYDAEESVEAALFWLWTHRADLLAAARERDRLRKVLESEAAIIDWWNGSP